MSRLERQACALEYSNSAHGLFCIASTLLRARGQAPEIDRIRDGLSKRGDLMTTFLVTAVKIVGGVLLSAAILDQLINGRYEEDR
jgi:hypothetical protein